MATHDPTGADPTTPSPEERDDDPDKEPTSQAGAASDQAAQAGEKEQADGGEEEAEETGEEREDREAVRSGPSGASSGGLAEWEEQVAREGPERPDLPREGDTRHQPPRGR